eukprot:COSAG01_NODE_2653_length_7307_cov_31.893868_8_plen_57_part_00
MDRVQMEAPGAQAAGGVHQRRAAAATATTGCGAAGREQPEAVPQQRALRTHARTHY